MPAADQVGRQRVVDPVDPSGRDRGRQFPAAELGHRRQVLTGERELFRDRVQTHQACGVGACDEPLREGLLRGERVGDRRQVQLRGREHRPVAVQGLDDVAADNGSGVETEQVGQPGRRTHAAHPRRRVAHRPLERPAARLRDRLRVAERAQRHRRGLRHPGGAGQARREKVAQEQVRHRAQQVGDAARGAGGRRAGGAVAQCRGRGGECGEAGLQHRTTIEVRHVGTLREVGPAPGGRKSSTGVYPVLVPGKARP